MSGLYNNFVTEYGLGNIDLVNDNIVLIPVDDGYVFDPTDINVDEISINFVGSAVAIGGTKYVTVDSLFDTSEGKTLFPGLATGSDINAFVMYKNTGVEATSELISYHSDDFNGKVIATTGGDLELIKSTGGFFQVTPANVFEGRVASFVFIRLAQARHDQQFRS